MTLIKIVTAANWVVIGLLFILMVVEFVNPSPGGDAATAGLGKALLYLAAIVLALLLILNLLPYDLPKYIAFGLIVTPILLIKLTPKITKLKRNIVNKINAKPYFEDKERNQIAEALFAARPEKVKKYVEQYSALLRDTSQGYPVMLLAVDCITRFGDKQEQRYECLQILFNAGISTKDNDPETAPLHVGSVSLGNPPLLEFLLKHGLDANAKSNDYGTGTRVLPIMFEAMDTPYSAYENMKLLLQYGANPNSTKRRDGDLKNVSALMYAAMRFRWDICLMLLEKGADPSHQTPNDYTLAKFVDEGQDFVEDTYSTREDFEKLKRKLGKK